MSLQKIYPPYRGGICLMFALDIVHRYPEGRQGSLQPKSQKMLLLWISLEHFPFPPPLPFHPPPSAGKPEGYTQTGP